MDIYDDLHGIVQLKEHEAAIIDSPWFQRLRRIRQLGLAHMVFPGAEHTRFAHSIGVFHLASRIANQFEGAIPPEHKRELRAAALLHDVGHFPFSHTLEGVYKAVKKKQDRLLGRDPTQHDGTEEEVSSAERRDKGTAFHEKFGKQIIEGTDVDGGIAQILKNADLEPGRVAGIVVGEHENLLLNQILKSDLDVDQLDYLLRDAKATGSSYGRYDLDYLVECMHVAYLEDSPVLCVRIQGLHPLEHYVLARYFYFLCILYQKTRCVAEAILQAVANRLIDKKLLPSWDRLEAEFSRPWFCGFDDAYVWASLREAASDDTVDGNTREAIGMLMNRQLPKVVWEAHVTGDEGGKLPDGVESGRHDGEWNVVVGEAVDAGCKPKFDVLKKALRKGDNSEEALRGVLTSDPRPIRLLVQDPYVVPDDTPSVPAQDSKGKIIGKIVLLESLRDSIVAKLAGLTTYIARVYRPHETPGCSPKAHVE